MALTFSDLHTEEGDKSVEEHLAEKISISGGQISEDDVKVYPAILEKHDDSFPNPTKWYDCVNSQFAKFPRKSCWYGNRFIALLPRFLASPSTSQYYGLICFRELAISKRSKRNLKFKFDLFSFWLLPSLERHLLLKTIMTWISLVRRRKRKPSKFSRESMV